MKNKTFDPEKAIEQLKEDKKEYVKKAVNYINESIDKFDNYESAANYITAAADNLKVFDDVIDFIEAIKRYNGECPHFGTIFD